MAVNYGVSPQVLRYFLGITLNYFESLSVNSGVPKMITMRVTASLFHMSNKALLLFRSPHFENRPQY